MFCLSVCQISWANHRPHTPHSSGFSGENCLPILQAWILGVESADVLHLLSHHMLGDVILPEQTCRMEGWVS
jgi:hypothetical protein